MSDTVKRYNWTDPPQVFLADTFVAATDYDNLLAQHTRLKEAFVKLREFCEGTDECIGILDGCDSYYEFGKLYGELRPLLDAAAQQTPDGQEKGHEG